MRHDFRLQTPGFRLIVVLASSVVLAAPASFALNADNPYTAISGRNVFALKPPTPPPTIDPNKVNTPPPNIELQGFTTILGRAQVLLKIKSPPKPPEPAKDRNLVMDVGQREGEVEVLEMDAYAGTVKLRNQGNALSLNLKDNAAKPTPGAALPPPALPPPNMGLPVPPAGTPPPAAVPSATGVPSIPTPRSNLPTRSLRSASTATPTEIANNPNDNRNLPLEAQMALIEVERERTREAVEAGKMPPIPGLSIPSK